MPLISSIYDGVSQTNDIIPDNLQRKKEDINTRFMAEGVCFESHFFSLWMAATNIIINNNNNNNFIWTPKIP